MKKYMFIILLFLVNVGFAGSVFLLNDSSHNLTAIVQSANGTFLGKVTIQPGQQNNFTADFSAENLSLPGNPDTSLTPYTVTWQCSYKGVYSISNNVSPGGLVRATEGFGDKFCQEKPKKDDND
jgi:hypothetical protein